MGLFQTLLLHQRSMCSKGLNKDETEYVHAYGVKLICHASVRKSSIVLLNFGEVWIWKAFKVFNSGQSPIK